MSRHAGAWRCGLLAALASIPFTLAGAMFLVWLFLVRIAARVPFLFAITAGVFGAFLGALATGSFRRCPGRH